MWQPSGNGTSMISFSLVSERLMALAATSHVKLSLMGYMPTSLQWPSLILAYTGIGFIVVMLSCTSGRKPGSFVSLTQSPSRRPLRTVHLHFLPKLGASVAFHLRTFRGSLDRISQSTGSSYSCTGLTQGPEPSPHGPAPARRPPRGRAAAGALRTRTRAAARRATAPKAAAQRLCRVRAQQPQPKRDTAVEHPRSTCLLQARSMSDSGAAPRAAFR
mmetsp:Transcript_48044/g.133512  ORF Transcript_48044/g.133512 Transcript_48044/m.133512 type:complete len:217 (+) Transcript_48044:609-1259(+)